MKKKFLPVLLLGIVLLIGGAALLYNRLAPSFAADPLSTYESPVSTEPPITQEPTTTQEPTASNASTDEPQTMSAPDFTVYTAEGDPVQLSDYFGKPIVLNFWASWCGPCKMEMPDFQQTYAELGEQVQFLMINMTDGSRETVETASAFISENGFTFPVFYDTDYSAALTYQVYSLPTTYFLSAEGELIAQASGAIDQDTLMRGIEMIAP